MPQHVEDIQVAPEHIPVQLPEGVQAPSESIQASSQQRSLTQPTPSFIPPLPEPRLRMNIIIPETPIRRPNILRGIPAKLYHSGAKPDGNCLFRFLLQIF